MNKNKNKIELEYTKSLQYRILIKILPLRFLDSISYNAIIDTLTTISDSLILRELSSDKVKKSIKDTT